MRMTMAQALVKALAAQLAVVDGREVPLCAGVWAIFGHGNVAGLGEALESERALPTLRAHNESAMGFAAAAFARQVRRRRFMACTTSIGPGATNLVTAAALAHVNRLPVLFLPGDVFANRVPDPVLQQVEDFSDLTVSANDCLRPVSRLFDRITRPEQLLTSLPAALAVLTDPAACGPVTLALCQDVQAEAWDFPEAFFAPRVWHVRRPPPDGTELARASTMVRAAKRPIAIAGGGVHFSGASAVLADFAMRHAVPVVETQAGRGAVPDAAPWALGAVGVTGTEPANRHLAEADLVLAVGTRLADFTTGSRRMLADKAVVSLNVQAFDTWRGGAEALVADAAVGLAALSASLGDWRSAWAVPDKRAWEAAVARVTAASNTLPSDAQAIGAVRRAMPDDAILVAAAGGLPGELHRLWRTTSHDGYHCEYGYSTMGYEIAGGLGVKIACPERPVVVMVGDGSWLMLNSEIATSVAMGLPLIVVLLDNSGFGCIERLQHAVGGASFNNRRPGPAPDFVAQARGLGAIAEKVADIAALEAGLARALTAERTTVLVLDTDGQATSAIGGAWWDVPVAEVSARAEVRAARQAYEQAAYEQAGR
jgi:3D-(3,5/4)-trihydroxycyclohexane-1,2-dione acylhydrolase (decyclizing)